MDERVDAENEPENKIGQLAIRKRRIVHRELLIPAQNAAGTPRLQSSEKAPLFVVMLEAIVKIGVATVV
jgi:hypothetical protein